MEFLTECDYLVYNFSDYYRIVKRVSARCKILGALGKFKDKIYVFSTAKVLSPNTEMLYTI